MVFLFICIFITVSIIMYFSNIQVETENFRFSSITKKHVKNDYRVIIRWRIFSKIPIVRIVLTQNKIDKIKVEEKIKNINFDKLKNSNIFDKKNLTALKKINIEIEKMKLNIDIGTENAMLTAIIVPVISTIISGIISIKTTNYENKKFVVNPVYINENLVNIEFSGILELKIRNIIYIIYLLSKKEGVISNERTSNRGSYDYSYE